MTFADIQQSGFSRVFYLKNRAGPRTVPQYMGLWRAGAMSWDGGDSTRQYAPDPAAYNKFRVVDIIRGEPGNPEMTLTARMSMDLSIMLKALKSNCPFDVQIHYGICKNPQLFNSGFDKALVLENATATNYSTDEQGALGPDEQALVNEMLDVSAGDAYEVKPLAYSRKAGLQIINEVIDIQICSQESCGRCGLPTDPCQVIVAIAFSTGDSPGLPAELIYSLDGGYNWLDSDLTSVAVGTNPRKIICWGKYLVVASASFWHYALISEALNVGGTNATWTTEDFGFSGGSPTDFYAPDAGHLYSIGSSSAIYLMQSVDAITVLHRTGDVTTEVLYSIHGTDSQQFIVGAGNSQILLTRNGGATFTLVQGPMVSLNLTAVWMVSDNVWWVGGSDGNLYYTVDSGVNWFQKAFAGDGAGNLVDIKFATPSVGYLLHTSAAPAGRVFRTIDGGQSWVLQPDIVGSSMPTNIRLQAVAVCDDPNIAFFGGNESATDGLIVQAG